jgi:RNA polymerase sigma factor (sigma-70 family)
MTEFTPEERSLIEDPKVWTLLEKLLSYARGRGIQISDDVRSDAAWSICLAAKRFKEEKGSEWCSYATPWIQGAIGRSARKARRYQSNEIDQAARDEVEPDDLLADRLTLLRAAIKRLDSPIREVAELRAKGLGIRRIAKELGRTFHETREQYDATTEALAQQIGFRVKQTKKDGKVIREELVTVPRPLFEGFY